MPARVLAAASSRLSYMLHHLIYAFPSPNAARPHGAEPPAHNHDDAGLTGEARAMAAGIGPLSFAGSTYGIILVLMAILLNRITHVVRAAPRTPPQPQPHPLITSPYHRIKRRISRALIHPSTPRYLRIPGIFLLLRAWTLFTIISLQVAHLWPAPGAPLLQSTATGRFIDALGQWAGNMAMDKVCMQVFGSVCTGLVTSALANGLERGRRRDQGNSFNLFGYSFLLHLYSSPLTHHRPFPSATQGRPDIHALFQLWLSLTELTWLQAIELSPSIRQNQLLPTAVCGVMGLTHFVYALSTSPLLFPSFTFLTHLMALFLSIIIVLSMALKGFTHLFTLGYIPSPILANLLPHEGVTPNIEDDFGVMILKIGTACIEATQYSGLRNELVSIDERPGPWLELSQSSSSVKSPFRSRQGGLDTEIIDMEVTKIDDPRTESAYWREWRNFWTTVGSTASSMCWSAIMATAFGRRCVELTKSAYHGRWWWGPRGWRVWRKEVWREPIHLRVQRAQKRGERIRARERIRAEQSSAVSTALQLRETTPEPTQWREILRGEVDVEDDEGDWEDGSSTSSHSSSGSEADDDDLLYRDITNEHEDIQPILLAHLTNPSTPLTRRRYAAILSPPRSDTPTALTDVIQDRRAMVHRSPAADDEGRRCCVVCQVEERTVILWPCRCLALCDDCRDSLASRLASKDHMCPCCRRKIDGYSKIYIP